MFSAAFIAARLADPSNTTYFTDGAHPSDAGDVVIVERVKPAVLAAH